MNKFAAIAERELTSLRQQFPHRTIVFRTWEDKDGIRQDTEGTMIESSILARLETDKTTGVAFDMRAVTDGPDLSIYIYGPTVDDDVSLSTVLHEIAHVKHRDTDRLSEYQLAKSRAILFGMFIMDRAAYEKVQSLEKRASKFAIDVMKAAGVLTDTTVHFLNASLQTYGVSEENLFNVEQELA